MFALGCGQSYGSSFYSSLASGSFTSFFNCTFIGNSATTAGGAIESATGFDYIESSVFSGNTAGEGGALRLRGTATIVNSSFFDNKSGEDGGCAISNVGIISEIVGLNFSGNSVQCPRTHYLDFNVSEASVSSQAFSRKITLGVMPH